MTGSGHLFQGDHHSVALVDLDGPLESARGVTCSYFRIPYQRAAQSSHETGDVAAAAVFAFAAHLVGFHPSFDTPDMPYKPFFTGDGKRTPIPSDLSSEDIQLVARLTQMTNEPVLLARLFDLLWLLKKPKDHEDCARAARFYLESAVAIDPTEKWVHACEAFGRALQLASKLGRKKELYQSICEAVRDAIYKSQHECHSYKACKYLRLAQRHRCGDPAEFAAIAERMAESESQTQHNRHARKYWEVAADLWHDARELNAVKRSRLAAAETYLAEAEIRMSGTSPSALAAAGIFIKGIEALRRAGGDREKIKMLRKRLAEIQEASTAEMKSFSTGVDISEGVQKARKYVQDADMKASLFRFALGYPLTNLTELKETIRSNANEFAFQHIIGSSLVDSKGRVIKQKSPLLGLSGPALEKRLDEEMVSYAAQFLWPIRATGYIDPARNQICNDHQPTFDDLLFLVTNNPFIPPGHEEIFLRGFHAGLHGDDLIASHLLVPQIENSIRYVLESHGVDVTNLEPEGEQPLKTLGALFDVEETRKFFGESLCFELRGALIEKTGFGFRNRLAHGFVSTDECFSPAAAFVWWLVLRICIFPVYVHTRQMQGNAASVGAGDSESPQPPPGS